KGTSKRSGEVGAFLGQRTLGQCRELDRVRRTAGQSRQHQSPRHTEYLRGHRREFDIRTLQQLLDTKLTGAPSLQQLAPITRDLTKLSNVRWWHKVRLNQTVTQQFGDPQRIARVRLPARHVRHVTGIAESHLNGAF